MELKYENFKAFFFDLGGTILDATKDKRAHFEILSEIILRYGIPITAEEALNSHYEYLAEEINKETFINTWDALERALHKLFSEYTPGISLDFPWIKDLYFKYHDKYVDVAEGAIEVLNKIKSKNLYLGIISDIDNDYMEFQLEKLKIKDMFDSITTSEEVRAYKPNPQIFEKALSKAKIEGKDAIYIGDNYWRDIIGAKKVGMTAVLIGDPPMEQFATKGIEPDIVIDKLKELLNIIK